MNTVTKPADEFTVAQLKETLQARGLKSSGTKLELITRLMEADPSGEWMTMPNQANSSSDDSDSGGLANEDTNGAGPSAGSADKTTLSQKDIELILKEKEWALREAEWLRRELEMTREIQRLSAAGASTSTATPTNQTMSATPKVHSSILSLLGYFEGKGATFETWKKQAMIVKNAHQLDEAATKILVVSRLQGKALEWFHSRSDYLEMPVDNLIDELENAFYDRPTMIEGRRDFEARLWKKEESFAEYAHEKTILANRISVGEQELIEYLVDGIPDYQLQRNARLQKFETKAALLDRFRSISLRGGVFRGSRPGTSNDDTKWRAGGGNIQRGSEGSQRASEGSQRGNEGSQRGNEGSQRGNEGSQRGNEGSQRGNEGFQRRSEGSQRPGAEQNQRRCFNCGGHNHLSSDCPMKSRGRQVLRVS